MRCFNKDDAHNAIVSWTKDVQKEIGALSDREMDGTERDAWIDYFCCKHEVVPVTMFPNQREYSELVQKTVKKFNTWYPQIPTEPQFYDTPGVKITCRVPYRGNPVAFDLSASINLCFNYEAEDVKKPGADGIGYLVLSHELSLNDASPEVIGKYFDYVIGQFSDEIERINQSTASFNSSLRDVVTKAIDARAADLEKYSALWKGLNIPLNRSAGAPMAVPIPLEKKRLQFSRPQPTYGEPSHCIFDSDYQYITDVIDGCCSMMEASPRSYKPFEEEELRDHILSVLNTHFTNSTGETFRRHGKADIHIPFGEHTAYIAECKVWHGAKKFREAIRQLFSYTTWRDTKVSLVVFNKDIKNYEKVRGAIQSSLDEVAVSVANVKPAVWRCRIQNQEDERIMDVTVQAFDLHFIPDAAH